MTGPGAPGYGGRPGDPGPGGPGPAPALASTGPGTIWRAARPEIIIAAVAVAATAVAGYAVAGRGALAVVAVAAGVISLVVLRSLVRPLSLTSPPEDVSGPDPAVPAPVLSSFSRQWRRRSRLADAQASMAAYEAGVRGQLEHLLASRLAERHGISLYEDPAAARRVFAGGSPGHDSLWPWIDPAQAAGSAKPADQPGIPYRTLIRLIDRLEHL
ncbi:MAG: hypothetical protein QOG05_7010 [Streptosporangiaceae bacterium]|jgi:hypothetical protein|nr:hypothetical protein [Streptosporangiaceae bacterium]